MTFEEVQSQDLKLGWILYEIWSEVNDVIGKGFPTDETIIRALNNKSRNRLLFNCEAAAEIGLKENGI